jgi:cysteine-rich repeat protein
MLLPSIAALLLMLALVPPSYATTADDVCPPATDPCVLLSGTIAVTDGSVLDFGTRDFVLGGGAANPRLDAAGGGMVIIAGSVTLNSGSALLARGGTIALTVSGDVTVAGNARIDVSDFVSPGTVTIDADGDVAVQGVITTQGTGAESGNGVLSVLAMGNVLVPGTINLQGGSGDLGGDVIIQAPMGSVSVTGLIDATGGFGGGGIDITAGDTISTFGFGRLDAKATGSEGDGGSVDLLSTGGDINLQAAIEAQGSDGLDFGGSGGDVTIEAVVGNVTLAGPVNQNGATPDGDGGDLDVTAGLDLVHTGAVTAIGRNQSGVGGAIYLEAARMLTVGPVEASGMCKTCSGGDVSATAWCGLTLPAGVTVHALGLSGIVAFASGGDMDVHGNVEAGQLVDLLFRDAANPPDVSGAVIVPAPRLRPTATLVPCGGPPGINCGNNTIDANETCDDGNKDPCDGCSPICLDEVCGDGRLGCDQDGVLEVCDDGNTASGDGCVADCSRRDCVCGDGMQECDELCDIGPAIDCDPGACSAQCEPEECGNGRIECTEECDDGGPSPTCDGTCMLLPPPTCGNGGDPEPGETCDDGNTVDCDGCSQFCQIESCGNGTTECQEECDDFNTTPCDGCAGDCRAEECGNEIVDCGEDCDEGALNGTPGSTCLADVCTTGTLCTVDNPAPCIPCGDALDCDPLGRCGGVNCVEGVCTPQTLSCTSTDPCEIGTCVAELGCVFEQVQGFDSIQCRLTDLESALESDGVDLVARVSLGKLVDKAQAKITAAESAQSAGSLKKTKKGFKGGRKAMLKIGKKILKLQPKHIPDPSVGEVLSQKASNAVQRIDDLRAELAI